MKMKVVLSMEQTTGPLEEESGYVWRVSAFEAHFFKFDFDKIQHHLGTFSHDWNIGFDIRRVYRVGYE